MHLQFPLAVASLATERKNCDWCVKLRCYWLIPDSDSFFGFIIARCNCRPYILLENFLHLSISIDRLPWMVAYSVKHELGHSRFLPAPIRKGGDPLFVGKFLRYAIATFSKNPGELHPIRSSWVSKHPYKCATLNI